MLAHDFRRQVNSLFAAAAHLLNCSDSHRALVHEYEHAPSDDKHEDRSGRGGYDSQINGFPNSKETLGPMAASGAHSDDSEEGESEGSGSESDEESDEEKVPEDILTDKGKIRAITDEAKTNANWQDLEYFFGAGSLPPPPEAFPDTLGDFRAFDGPCLSGLLQLYGLPPNNLVNDNRRALAEYFCIQL
ncbi:unnamed protein product [Rhizoctonia solani]|uniref:Uncharacterized protein n=1 Tax=Rhizoctonia solani TaxID=456999 RepID=A0A8H3E4S2_9AGAM|nr:unnamed protein product [Rhizoctonia solani]